MEVSNFKTVFFAIVFVVMNGHTYKSFKYIFNDIQTENNGEINKA